ncbi:helix-turn-helix domain-containing protein [Kineococcus sp. SYSU DK004]|uniref:helix-turn-helix domain-containing protein n=1 Tax=Kineococcus sp. SYSU DK004 TaxID=3383125 RepID=UPI003D7C8D0E
MADTEVLGPALWVHRGAAPSMPAFHRHDDLEVNLVVRGRLEYLFAGAPVVVPEGHLALFWAASPHRLLPAPGAGPSDVCWVHLPLAEVLTWSLPPGGLADLLTDRVAVVPATEVGAHVEALFTSWCRDLAGAGGDPGDPAAVLLEANALVRRVLRAAREHPPAAPGGDEAGHVVAMARFAADRFRGPVTVADVARAANLHPHYAAAVFKQALGTTIGEHLTRLRVAEAQRLLLTTTLTTAAVAHAAGFGSQSSLYAHFGRATGRSPAAYREGATRGLARTLTRTGRSAAR